MKRECFISECLDFIIFLLCLAGVSAAGKKTHTCESLASQYDALICCERYCVHVGSSERLVTADLETCWPVSLSACIYVDNISFCFQLSSWFVCFPHKLSNLNHIMKLKTFTGEPILVCNVNETCVFHEVSMPCSAAVCLLFISVWVHLPSFLFFFLFFLWFAGSFFLPFSLSFYNVPFAYGPSSSSPPPPLTPLASSWL